MEEKQERVEIYLQVEGEVIGNKKPWIAQITGPDEKFGLERKFLSGARDWSQANSKRTRGVKDYFTITMPGIYEYSLPRNWKKTDRGFWAIAEAGEKVEITMGEVLKRI